MSVRVCDYYINMWNISNLIIWKYAHAHTHTDAFRNGQINKCAKRWEIRVITNYENATHAHIDMQFNSCAFLEFTVIRFKWLAGRMSAVYELVTTRLTGGATTTSTPNANMSHSHSHTHIHTHTAVRLTDRVQQLQLVSAKYQAN